LLFWIEVKLSSKQNNLRLNFTQQFLDECEFDPPKNPQKFFWYNFRDNGGLRLSDDGYDFLKSTLNKDEYTIKIDSKKIKKTPQFLLDMDRMFEVPYYLAPRQKIILFDQKAHFTMTMYNNDFRKFLDAHKI